MSYAGFGFVARLPPRHESAAMRPSPPATVAAQTLDGYDSSLAVGAENQ